VDHADDQRDRGADIGCPVDAAHDGVEPAEHLGLRQQPGERGRDPGQHVETGVDEPPQVAPTVPVPGAGMFMKKFHELMVTGKRFELPRP